MELRHLRYFIAVADELSFSRAAERLHIAQPPLSQQIQALEAELGVKLFDRTSRPLRLTSAGQALLEDSRAMLIQLEQAVHKTRRIHQGELGHLTVGFASSMANGIFPEILRSFRQQCPDVKLILHEENSGFLPQRLRDRQVDIIFLYLYDHLSDVPEFTTYPLTQESLVVVLPKSHRLAARSTIAMTELRQEEFIMPLQQVVSGLPEQIYKLCAQASFVPIVAQTAVFMVTILGLVAGETGISILPSHVQNLQREGVIYRPIQELTPITQLTAVWRSDHPSLLLTRFLPMLENLAIASGVTMTQ